jgi:hypothetical protein
MFSLGQPAERPKNQWIGLSKREKLQENPIFNGKIYGFL